MPHLRVFASKNSPIIIHTHTHAHNRIELWKIVGEGGSNPIRDVEFFAFGVMFHGYRENWRVFVYTLRSPLIQISEGKCIYIRRAPRYDCDPKIGNGLSVFSADQIFKSIRFNRLSARPRPRLLPLRFFATCDEVGRGGKEKGKKRKKREKKGEEIYNCDQVGRGEITNRRI